MTTALQIKVVGLIGYVAVSTALVLLLPEDELRSTAQTMIALAGVH